MSEHYDVIIIGGGIAGLSTAVNITDGNVLLLERDKIRTKEKKYTRFTFLNSMDRFGLSDAILRKCNVLSYRFITGSTFDFYFDDFEMLVLDLGKIHGTLKKQVEKTHEIREGIKIIDAKQNNHKIEVKISENNDIKTISAKYLVDASGNGFFTRKKFNLNCSDFFCGCLGASFKDGYLGEQNILTLILPADQFRCGGWLYPLNSDDYSFGITDIFENIVSPKIILNEIFDYMKEQSILEDIISGGIKQEWDLGIIPVGVSHPLVFDRICYVGDVVGQATPWHIDGIRPILETSIMCANTINITLNKKDKSLLNTYQKRWDSTYGKVYNNYNHWEKWAKTTSVWEETSMKHMQNIFKCSQEQLINALRYQNMPESDRKYLKNLTSQFYQ